MKKLIVISITALLIGGCASKPAQQETVAADAVTPKTLAKSGKTNAKGYSCKKFKPTGSHRTQTICTTKEQEDALARQTQDRVRSRNQGNKAVFGDG